MRQITVQLELLLRLVSLLVTASEALAPLADRVGRLVGLLVEAATGPLVDLFLALGEGLVRLVAEPLRVHVDHLLRARLPQTARPGNRNAVAGRDQGRGIRWFRGGGNVVKELG
jgi:hypothetical protein